MSGHRPLKTLQHEASDRFGIDKVRNKFQESARRQDLTVLGFAAEPGGQICDGANRSIVFAFLESDHA
jgi:hypothetical protein